MIIGDTLQSICVERQFVVIRDNALMVINLVLLTGLFTNSCIIKDTTLF